MKKILFFGVLLSFMIYFGTPYFGSGQVREMAPPIPDEMAPPIPHYVNPEPLPNFVLQEPLPTVYAKQKIMDVVLEIRTADFKSKDEIPNEMASRVEELVSSIVRTEKKESIAMEEILRRDSDNDEISDYQEIVVFKSNPLSADSDGDGTSDGLEIKNSYDPLDSSPAGKAVFEDLKIAGKTNSNILKVTDIKSEIIEETQEERIELTGVTLPHTVATVYIYSDVPVVGVVKSDKYGYWNYILDRSIQDGDHEAYIAINDNTGKVLVKSEKFSFIKKARAVTAIAESPAIEAITPLATKITIGIIIIVGLILVVYFVIRATRKKRE